MNNDQVTELRQEILSQLAEVNKRACPVIWEYIQTKEGYAHIERRVIAMVCADGITPSAAIGQIESELDWNGND